MNKWVLIDNFIEKYEIDINLINVKIWQGTIPDFVITGKRKEKYINETYFLKRAEFKKMVWHESHKNYYFLNSIFSATDIAKMLVRYYNAGSVDSWIGFMNDTLWALDDRITILSQQVKNRMWKFWRATSHIIRAIFVSLNIPKYKRKLSELTLKIEETKNKRIDVSPNKLRFFGTGRDCYWSEKGYDVETIKKRLEKLELY